ncbi:hypothetical protein [Cellulomonas xylanilytica]|uniref:Uncharacterized protein n=1 Tax=Cellulomonas xylanilytica TaxID=233583 RepID=A0A510V100_9CELL|nr:hypothetical protein [Cellulomonas xylanilytica]GEK19491.1 hypothetical protein CXY01_00110 [Cellulomonas xylanilytica]
MPKKPRRDLTEWLLTYLGPAQVGNPRGPRKVLSDDEVARDAELQQQFDRVVDARGRTFLVERGTTGT